jgi:hypothetical protein
MSVRVKSSDLRLSENVGGVIATGAATPPTAGNSIGMREVSALKDSALASFVSNYSSYTTSDVRLSTFFGNGGAGYTKHRLYWNSLLGRTGTNSLNGAILAGTNGDHEGTVVGRDASGNWYYAVGFQSHSWRPGANLYRISASGHGQGPPSYEAAGVTRVFSYHHLADMISDQSWTVVPLDNIFSTAGNGYFAIATRYQNNGLPVYLTTRWSASYDGVTSTADIEGRNNLAINTISGVSEWGQVLDAINLPNSDARYTTGVVLWQRQWWGQRLIFNKRNGSTGILNTHIRHMDQFNGYQNWTNDHNSGNASGLTWSPNTNRIYLIHVHGDCQSVCRSLSINHVSVGNINGTGTITTGTPSLGLIHFIWGGWNSCLPDWGYYTGSHICWIGYSGGEDRLAYAFMRERNSPYGYWPGSNGLWFRIVRTNGLRTGTYPSVENNKCSYPEIYEQFVTSDVNYYQRIRVRRLGIQRVHNSGNSLIAEYAWVALSWVTGGQQNRIRVYRINIAANTVQYMAQYNFSENYRGSAAFNGSFVSTDYEPQHLLVIGTDNTGLQQTYVWSSGKPYNPGYDQDRTTMLRFM